MAIALGCSHEETSRSGATPNGPPPARVVLEALEARPLIETRSFYGEVRAASDAQLSPAESGRVLRVHVVEGNRVKKGQVLVELDDQLARARLNEALAQNKQTTAQKQQAELELQRYAKMREQEIVSELEATRKESEAHTLDAEAESGRAKVAQGAELVRRHRIIAPFDGIVVGRNVDPGDWLNAGQLALQLVTAEHVEVDVHVPGRMLDRIDDLSRLVIEDQGRRVEAALDSAVQALDPRTRTALLRLTPSAPAPWLRVGASVQCELFIEREDGTTIPRDALVYGIANTRVFVEDEGKAKAVDVEVLATSESDALIKKGALALGTKLVTKGNERLRPGQPITDQDPIVPAQPKP